MRNTFDVLYGPVPSRFSYGFNQYSAVNVYGTSTPNPAPIVTQTPTPNVASSASRKSVSVLALIMFALLMF